MSHLPVPRGRRQTATGSQLASAYGIKSPVSPTDSATTVTSPAQVHLSEANATSPGLAASNAVGSGSATGSGLGTAGAGLVMGTGSATVKRQQSIKTLAAKSVVAASASIERRDSSATTASSTVFSTTSSNVPISGTTHTAAAIATTTKDLAPVWNSTKLVSTPKPSRSVSRSKSYAASLKKDRGGNVVSASTDNNHSDNDDDSFVNGQSRTTRTLSARVAELEATLTTTANDLRVTQQQLDTAQQEHAYAVDKLKLDCDDQLHALRLQHESALQLIKSQVTGLSADNERANLKIVTQQQEIAKLHTQVVEATSTLTHREVEAVAAVADADANKHKAQVLQQELVRLQTALRAAAQDALAKEVALEATIEDKRKEMDLLSRRVAVERTEHDRTHSNAIARLEDVLQLKETRIQGLIDREAALVAQVDSVTAVFEDLQLDTARTRESLASASIKITSLEETLQLKETRIQGLMDQESASVAQVDSLTALIKDLQLDAARTSESLASAGDKVASLDKSIADKEMLLIQASSDVAKLNTLLSEKAEKIIQLEVMLTDAQNALEKTIYSTSHKDTEKSRIISELQGQLESSQNVTTALESNVSQLEEFLKAKTTTLEFLQSALTSSQDSLAASRVDAISRDSVHVQNVADLTSHLAQREDSLTALNAQLASATAEITALRDALARTGAEVKEAHDARQAAQEALSAGVAAREDALRMAILEHESKLREAREAHECALVDAVERHAEVLKEVREVHEARVAELMQEWQGSVRSLEERVVATVSEREVVVAELKERNEGQLKEMMLEHEKRVMGVMAAHEAQSKELIEGHESVLQTREEDLVAARGRVATLEAELNLLMEKHQEILSAREDALTGLTACESELEAVKGQLRIALAEWEQGRTDMIAELEALQMDKEETVKQLKGRVDEFMHVAEARLEENTALQSQLYSAVQSHLDVKVQLEKAIADKETAFLTLKMESENKIAEQVAIISQMKQEAVVLALDIQDRSNNEERLNALILESDNHVAALKKELEVAKESLKSGVASSQRDKEFAIAKLVDEMATLKTLLDSSKTQESKLEASMNQVTKSLELTTRQLQSERDNHEITKQTLKVQMDEALAAKQTEVTELRRRGSTQELETETLRSALVAKEAEVAQLKQAVVAASVQVKTLQATVTDHISSVTKVKEENIFLTKRLEIVERNLELQTSRNSRLLSEYRSSKTNPHDSVRNSVDRSASVRNSFAEPSLKSPRDSVDSTGIGSIPRSRFISPEPSAHLNDDRPPTPLARPGSMVEKRPQSIISPRPMSYAVPPGPPSSVRSSVLEAEGPAPSVEKTVASLMSQLDSAFDL